MQLQQGPTLSLPLRSQLSGVGSLSYETLSTILDSQLVYFSADGEFFILQTFSGKLKIYNQSGEWQKTFNKWKNEHYTSSAMMELMRNLLMEWRERKETKEEPFSLRVIN